MPITLGTNLASLGAQRRLADTSNRISTVFERLSSGQRINRASDDAAGLAIATTLNSSTRVFTQASRNLNDGISALTIADSAMSNLQEIVTRQTELAAQAANGVYSTAQRAALNNEAQALFQEYARITATTSFNGINLLNGTTSGIRLQAGYGNNGSLNADYFAVGAGTAGGTSDAGTTSNSTVAFGATFSDVLSTGFLFGDLNNDGRQDIVAISAGGDSSSTNLNYSVDVFLGKASGGYSAPDATAANTYFVSSGGNLAGAMISGTLTDAGADGDLDIRVTLRAIDDGASLGTYEQEQLINNTVQNGGVFGMVTTYGANATGSLAALSNGGANLKDLNGDGFNDDIINNGDGTFTIRIHNTTTTAGTAGAVDDLTQTSFSLTTQSGAQSALTTLGALSTEISTAQGKIGAALSRITSATSVVQATTVNYAAAQSRIMSADIAAESSELTRNSILQQTATAVLAQANLQPQLALKLLAG